MNHAEIEMALAKLECEIAAVALGARGRRDDPRACVFGSAPMTLAGLRDAGDVDVFVSRGIFERLMRRDGWLLLRPREEDPPLLEFETAWGPVHVFYEWTERDASWVSAEMCWAAALPWRGLVWMIPLETVARIKAGCLARLAEEGVDPVGTVWEKHVRDLESLAARFGFTRAPGESRENFEERVIWGLSR